MFILPLLHIFFPPSEVCYVHTHLTSILFFISVVDLLAFLQLQVFCRLTQSPGQCITPVSTITFSENHQMSPFVSWIVFMMRCGSIRGKSRSFMFSVNHLLFKHNKMKERISTQIKCFNVEIAFLLGDLNVNMLVQHDLLALL